MQARVTGPVHNSGVVVALALLLLVIVPVSTAQEMSDEERFIGDYELVSYFTFPEQGPAVDMQYIGRLSYDEYGNMSGMGMPIDLPQREAAFRSGDERVIGGFAYWGRVSIDSEKHIVTHHVEGSPMVPRWVGGDNVRHYEFDRDLLMLSLKNPEGRITATLTWRRLS